MSIREVLEVKRQFQEFRAMAVGVILLLVILLLVACRFLIEIEDENTELSNALSKLRIQHTTLSVSCGTDAK